MKNTNVNKNGMKGKTLFITTGLFALLAVGCASQKEKDKDIKGMVATAAKQDLAFAGVSYTVRDGVVTLSGRCPNSHERDKIQQKVKNIAGVSGVLDLMEIAPVVLTSDFTLKQSVDSVLMKYAVVSGTVQDSVVTLHGELETKEIQALLKAVQTLQPKGVNHQLAVR